MERDKINDYDFFFSFLRSEDHDSLAFAAWVWLSFRVPDTLLHDHFRVVLRVQKEKLLRQRTGGFETY